MFDISLYTKTTGFNIDLLSSEPAFTLSESSNIASGASTPTTAQLTAPSGKTTSDFTAGKISDDTNPITLDIGADGYTELEWCIEATTESENAETYEFRVSVEGVALDTYTQYPEWTISTPESAETIQKGAVYEVITSITTPKNANYLIAQGLDSTKGADYRVDTDVTVQKDINYELSVGVTEQRGADYRVDTNVTAQKDIEYKVLVGVTEQRGVNYDVITGVTIQQACAYAIVDSNEVDVQKVLAYEVATQAGITKGADYEVTGSDTIQKDSDYLLRFVETIEKSLAYQIAIEITTQKGLSYQVRQQISITGDADYSVTQSIIQQKDASYGVVGEGDTQKDLVYQVARDVEIGKDLSYGVRETSQELITKGMGYDTVPFGLLPDNINVSTAVVSTQASSVVGTIASGEVVNIKSRSLVNGVKASHKIL